MRADWTWQQVLGSDPAGGTHAQAGFAGLAGEAERLSSVVDRLGRAPWTGEAADAFRRHAADLGRCVRDVQEVAEECRSAVAVAAADLDALHRPAGDAATLLNQLAAGGPPDELLELKAQAITAAERVHAQRDDLLDALAGAVRGSIERLLDFPPPASGSDELTGDEPFSQ